MLEYDPKNRDKTIVSLAYYCAVSIGVVFTALLTALPAAWQIAELRKPFAQYLSLVLIGLFSAVFSLLLMVTRKELTPRSRKWHAYLYFSGLVIFAFASIWFTYSLVRLAG